MHEAIHAWEMSWRRGSWGMVLETYRESWATEEATARRSEPDLSKWQRSGTKKVDTDLHDRYERGEAQVSAYIEYARTDPLRVWTIPDTGLPASELGFDVHFGSVQVKGFIDLIMEDPKTGALLVRDIKTGSKKPVGWFQLATYRHAVRKSLGVDPAWGDYWMAKNSAPTAPYHLADTPEALITSQFEVMDVAQRSGLYLANIGDHCSRCDVAPHCPFAGGTPPEGIPALGT